MSALGNGHVLMTNSPKLTEENSFSSERKLTNKGKKLWPDEINKLNYEDNLNDYQNIYNSNHIDFTGKEEENINRDDLFNFTKENSKNSWNINQIKEVTEKEEFSWVDSTVENKTPRKEEYTLNNEMLQKEMINDLEENSLDNSFDKENSKNRSISEISKNSKSLNSEKYTSNTSSEEIEFDNNYQLDSIISEPTVELKNSVVDNAQKLFKQVDSRSYLESMNKLSDVSQNKQSEISSKEKQNCMFVTNEEEGSQFDLDPLEIKLFKKNKKKESVKLVNKNKLYEPILNEEISSSLNLKLDDISDEIEQKRIITENIANNTCSSLNLEEVFEDINDSMRNFESFSQKTDKLGDTQKLFDVEIENEETCSMFLKQKNPEMEVRYSEGYLRPFKQEEPIPASYTTEKQNTERISQEESKSSKSDEEKEDSGLESLKELSVNEKLKRLIEKDKKKEQRNDAGFKDDLMQSSTGGNPKHNLKIEKEKQMALESQNLLQKIKTRTKEKKKNLLDFRRTKSPRNIRSSRKKIFPEEVNFWEINENFSKTTNFIDEEITHKEKIVLAKDRTRMRYSIKSFNDLNFKKSGRRSSKRNKVNQSLTDLINLKKKEAQLNVLENRTEFSKSQSKCSMKSQNILSMNDSLKLSEAYELTKNFPSKSMRNALKDYTKKSPTKIFKKLNLKGSGYNVLSSYTISPSSSGKKNINEESFSKEKLKFTQSPTLDNSLTKSKRINFSRKRITSKVFDRLSQPKGSLVVLKNSMGIKGLLSKAENQEMLSHDDVILSSFQGTKDIENKGIIFDSSLIKFDKLNENFMKLDIQNKKSSENLKVSSSEKVFSEEKYPLKVKNTKIDIESKNLIKTNYNDIHQKVDSLVLEIKQNTEDNKEQEKITEIKVENKEVIKPKKRRRRRAKTPCNSLKKEYRHLKPRKRTKFLISDEDVQEFLKRNKIKQKVKDKKVEIKIKKQFKNFFENSLSNVDNEVIQDVQMEKNIRKKTPDFVQKLINGKSYQNKNSIEIPNFNEGKIKI